MAPGAVSSESAFKEASHRALQRPPQGPACTRLPPLPQQRRPAGTLNKTLQRGLDGQGRPTGRKHPARSPHRVQGPPRWLTAEMPAHLAPRSQSPPLPQFLVSSPLHARPRKAPLQVPSRCSSHTYTLSLLGRTQPAPLQESSSLFFFIAGQNKSCNKFPHLLGHIN